LFGPEAFVSPQPAHRLFQRRRCEAADDGAAGFGTRDQGCVRQHVEMLHDRWQRHRKRTGQVADGCAFPPAQLGYERAPRRIGERRENVIQIGVLILNHIVNNTTRAKPCQAPRRSGRPSANRRHCFRFGRRPIRVAWESAPGSIDIRDDAHGFLHPMHRIASSEIGGLSTCCRAISREDRERVFAMMSWLTIDKLGARGLRR
jgi:hypothetical protein